jgi:AraC family transcriptional activator of pobA
LPGLTIIILKMPNTASIKSYKFKPGFRHEIEILSLEKLYAENSDSVSQPHRTNFYHVFWFQKSPQLHLVDFKPLHNLNDALLFVNKDQVQTFQRSPKVRGKVLLFTDSFLSKSSEDMLLLKNSVLFNDFLDTAIIKLSADSILIDCFQKIEHELDSAEDEYSYNVLRNLLHTFLLYCERERKKVGYTEIKKGVDLEYTILFKDLLNSSYKTLKSVSGYAYQIHVSEKRLTQATAKAVGKTPKELIDERVMLEAKRLLVHTSQSIKQVGHELGFEEPTNFIKYFKKHSEQTPIEFRVSH